MSFPTSPSAGQRYKNYRYSNGMWVKAGHLVKSQNLSDATDYAKTVGPNNASSYFMSDPLVFTPDFSDSTVLVKVTTYWKISQVSTDNDAWIKTYTAIVDSNNAAILGYVDVEESVNIGLGYVNLGVGTLFLPLSSQGEVIRAGDGNCRLRARVKFVDDTTSDYDITALMQYITATFEEFR